jgi:hypothetical protein
MPCTCPTQTGYAMFTPQLDAQSLSAAPSVQADARALPARLPVMAGRVTPGPALTALGGEVLDPASGTFVPSTEPEPTPDAYYPPGQAPWESQVLDAAIVPPKRDMVPILLAGAGVIGLLFLLRG